MAAPVILVLGPPGAGKGTQSALLASRLGGVHLSSGQILRDSGDPVIVDTLARGELARTEDFLRVVGDTLAAVPAERPIVLDSVGKMVHEAEWLQHTLQGLDRRVRAVLRLDVDEHQAVERARHRGRPDDDIDSQRLRWKLYRQETVPVLEFWDRQGLLRTVDGNGDVDAVSARIADALDSCP